MAAQRKAPGHFAPQDMPVDDEPKTLYRQSARSSSSPAHAAPGFDAEPLDVIEADDEYYLPERRGRGCLSFLAVIVCLTFALAAVGGFFGYKIYQSARSVQAEAKEVMSQVNSVKAAIKKGDSAALQSVAETVSEHANSIHAEVNTPLWDFATMVPVYGSDIRSVRVLADVLVDLSDNALTPVASNSNIMNLGSVMQDGGVNVSVLQGMTDALDQAAPAISRSADALEALPKAHISKVSDVLDKVKDSIIEADVVIEKAQLILPYLPQMLGANGQTRRYLIVAQNNSEARSTGGLPGSMGILRVTDGHFDLGDFTSILHEYGLLVDARDDEKNFWATNFNTDPAQVNFLADFSRVGELCRDYWSQSQGEVVDGVFAIDPVFLQHMIGLTGRVDIGDDYGSWIDGTDAARTLLNTVYVRWFPHDTYSQDLFFTQTAGAAAKSFFSNIGKASMTDLIETFFKDIDEHRFYAWMVDEGEEDLMVLLNADGKVGDDPAKPELGVYLNDSTFSKISWYLKLEVNVDNGDKHFDGTITYPVRVAVTNTLGYDEQWELPRLVRGTNDAKWSVGDIINRFFVLGPAGGTISDVVCETGEEVTMGSCYGVEGFKALMHTEAGETDVYTFKVTVPREAEEPLKVRTTPLGQEENIIITYAWEQ